MIDLHARRVADAVMYEGAFLYPYRRSSLKNRYRCTFGVLPPRPAAGGGEALTAACLLQGVNGARVEVLLRFLSESGGELLPREVSAQLVCDVERLAFEFDAAAGVLVLERCSLGGGYERLRACVQNQAEHVALHGVHVLLCVTDGAAHFVSLTDPGAEAEAYAAHCEGQGLWCTILGRDRSRPDTALAAPVILPDFPELAPESRADLGDATEIDEMLALRILTLSAAEKREARATDPWVARLLDRVEALSESELLALHGARRAPERLHGARVKLVPRRSADGIDLLLAGRTAVVCHVQQDVDGQVLLGVALEDDPGRDLGEQGLPGHRFFFGLDEVTVLNQQGAVRR